MTSAPHSRPVACSCLLARRPARHGLAGVATVTRSARPASPAAPANVYSRCQCAHEGWRWRSQGPTGRAGWVRSPAQASAWTASAARGSRSSAPARLLAGSNARRGYSWSRHSHSRPQGPQPPAAAMAAPARARREGPGPSRGSRGTSCTAGPGTWPTRRAPPHAGGSGGCGCPPAASSSRRLGPKARRCP
eukprot:scaffold12077_cov61-Phaeocystis_antarctica.AAC.4